MSSPNQKQTQEHQEKEHKHNENSSDESRSLPPPPEPSDDAGIVPPIKSPRLQGLDDLTPENVDIFNLDPVAALKLLCRGTQVLVDLTGDVPPTPAIQDHQNLPAQAGVKMPLKSQNDIGFSYSRPNEADHIDGIPFTRTPIGSPEAHIREPILHGSTSQPASVQYAALVRKFYSKRPPPISLEDYLSRMHKYCPMSTAVYLATSHYITHLSIREKICPVTPRNVHRLVLAGLRIAMKALEDLSWPHGRFAKVGGISEPELGRLEIGFCFLMDFGLKVDEQMLVEEAQNLIRMSHSSAVYVEPAVMPLSLPEPGKKQLADVSNGRDGSGSSGNGNGSGEPSTPKSTAEKRKASSSLPVRPVQRVGQGIGIFGLS